MKPRHYSQVFWNQVEKYGERIAMRCKENGAWREISWKSFGEQVRATSKALLEAGVGEQEAVGIFSQNRPEWSIADIGSMCSVFSLSATSSRGAGRITHLLPGWRTTIWTTLPRSWT